MLYCVVFIYLQISSFIFVFIISFLIPLHLQHSSPYYPSLLLQLVWRGFARSAVQTNYFNSLKKCYEPLMELLRFSVMFEKVREELSVFLIPNSFFFDVSTHRIINDFTSIVCILCSSIKFSFYTFILLLIYIPIIIYLFLVS